MTFDPSKYLPRYYKLVGEEIVALPSDDAGMIEWAESFETAGPLARTIIPNREPWFSIDVAILIEKNKSWQKMFGRGRPIPPKEEALEIHVSTVFLGLDHGFGDGPPILFETLVFNGPLKDEMERYCTYKEAIAGHHTIVKRVGDIMAMTTGEKVDADRKVCGADKSTGDTKPRGT